MIRVPVAFNELLRKQWEKQRFLCVGLDTDYAKLPKGIRQTSIADAIFEFNRLIIEATADFCGAYKPNIAFYEGYGLEGLDALIRTNRYLREHYPDIPIILDAKRADIGSTNQGYVKMVEDVFLAHGITVHPYLGREALLPFLERPHLGVIVLCHTSNPGASEFQDLAVAGGEPLYRKVAEAVYREWNTQGNCGLVLGATYPEQLSEVRKAAPDLPFLIPGVGAQGGDLEQTVKNGLDEKGAGIIINASRSIIYASSGDDFAEAARNEAKKMDRAIKAVVQRLS
ncbi:MAG TPA: orotidine-5'-phosphate decarboxylase [Bacillota bacterium]|nr:orotidine-5'-phosphate decarboxylase [Bacillota bacterium]